MHLYFGELLLSAAFLAAAFIILVAIFRGSNLRTRHDMPVRRQQPPIKRIAKKRDDDENDRKVA